MRAVHFGAGNIGRGFIGLLLSNSGYEVTFVDVNDRIVSALKERGEYSVTLADEQGCSEVVRGVTALLGSLTDEVAEAVAGSDLVTTAVGVFVLPHIAGALAAGIRRRLQAANPEPLQVIACENTIGGSSQLKRHVYEHLSGEERELADRRIAFPDAAVDRIVPLQQHADPLQVTVEPFYEWVITRPGMTEGMPVIEGVHYVESLEPYIARKLFTVNTGHCCAAYFGYMSGYETIQQVMADDGIRSRVYGVLKETGALLTRKYGFNEQEHEAYIQKILERFTNPYLTDDVLRVGRSPIRKLSPLDRLVMPTVSAYELDLGVDHLTTAIAAALQFDTQDDPEAVELQQALAEQGIREVIVRYMGISEEHPLHAAIVRQYEAARAQRDGKAAAVADSPVRLTGIAASPGIAIAKAYVLKKEQVVPQRQQVSAPSLEQGRFRAAVAAAKAELEAIRQSTLERLGEAKAEIFEGHLFLLKDPELVDAILGNIGEQKINAEYALYEVAQTFIDMFQTMDNELLQARAVDISDVCDRVMSHLRGVSHVDLAGLTEECMIIAEDLTPSDTARLNLQAVKGIINEVGSRTSHSAIMARSLEIPAIVGAGAGIMAIPNGTVIIADALLGEIIVHPTDEQLAEYRERKEQYDRRREELRKLKDVPTATADGHPIELAANIGKTEDLQKVLDNGAEGIGLFRTEFLYMDRSAFPTEDEQFSIYKHVLEKMNPKPVVIRTLDIGGDKELSYMELPKESNPFLGLRALRLCLERQDLFRTQLRALLRASIYGNLKIMFPMIAVLSEWHTAKELLLEEKGKLQEQGIPVAEQMEIGMMVEVPAAALTADAFAKEVDFFSIGTNDLIQYTMAADRMNESVSYLYQPCHPAILRLIQMVIEAARHEGKWVGMCGEMAGDSSATPLLMGLGLHEFSMSAGSILPTRELLSSLDYQTWAPLAIQALTLGSQQEVHQFMAQHLIEKERQG
jgi:phosphoenolpyruvate-protein phosphotransferase (PTS system enzyme I)